MLTMLSVLVLPFARCPAMVQAKNQFGVIYLAVPVQAFARKLIAFLQATASASWFARASNTIIL